MYNFWDYKNGHSHSLMALSVVFYQSLVSEVELITKIVNVMNRNEVMLHVGSKQVPSNVNSQFSSINQLTSIIENFHNSNICERVLNINGRRQSTSCPVLTETGGLCHPCKRLQNNTATSERLKAETIVQISRKNLIKRRKLECLKKKVIRSEFKNKVVHYLTIQFIYLTFISF